MTEIITSPEQDAVFVQRYVANGGDGIEAARTAGLLNPMFPIHVTIQQQLARPEIVAAIAAVKSVDKRAERHELTRESIITDIENIHDAGLRTGDLKAALAAKRLQAELLSLLVANVNVHHVHDVTMLSDAQLAKIAAGGIIDGEFTELKSIGQLKGAENESSVDT